MRRQPTDSVQVFLNQQFGNYGLKYIEYLFGSHAASLVQKDGQEKAIAHISKTLISKLLFISYLTFFTLFFFNSN